MSNLVTIPFGWAETTIGELGIGGTESIIPGSFVDEVFELWSVPAFSIKKPEVLTGSEIGSNKQLVQPGDVLLCKINPKINRVWKVDQKIKYTQIASTEWIVLRVPEVYPDFLVYRFQEQSFRDTLCANVSGVGGSLMRARPQLVEKLQIPLPPLNEQRRIVAKIEALRARTQRVNEELEAIPALLNQFRQSVLAAAFRGDLTADWREKNPDVEPAQNFLAFARDNKGWALVKAQDACLSVQSGSTPKDKPFTEVGEIPFLKVYNIVNQQIDFDYRPQYVTREIHKKPLKRSITLPNDVLINIVGPPLGKVALVTEQFSEWNINQALVFFRPQKGVLSKYLYYFFREGEFFRNIIVETKGIVGQVNISLTQCRNCIIKLPTEKEQTKIVSRIEALFAIADKLELAASIASEKINVLDRSILAKAFRGELVPQDPNDEPASVLLERIRAERAKLQVSAKDAKKSNGKTSGRRSRKVEQEETEPIQLELPGLELSFPNPIPNPIPSRSVTHDQ